jgi:FkbH-like protein
VSDGAVKCLVWDLDDTLWEGILLEGGGAALRPGVRETIVELDTRGILQSIASRNDRDVAMARLAELGVAEYFLHPQVSWGPKSDAIRRIAESLNLALDAFAFIDDQPFERDEVKFALPDVLCLDAAASSGLLARPELKPRFVTPDSAQRRSLYLRDADRKRDEESFEGPKEEFLAGLGIVFTVERAGPGDLERAEELTVRTHQLNSTGYTYSYEELDAFRTSPDHLLLVASLDDRYGTYGRIGLALVEKRAADWRLKLLLMSCRVMSRGVGGVLLTTICRRAQAARVRLQAEFIANDRNRIMLVAYRFAGFQDGGTDGGVNLLEANLDRQFAYPPNIRVVEPE